MSWTVLLVAISAFVVTADLVNSARRTRVQVLRSDEDKMRYLNRSSLMRQNLFFGKRPILYITRYNCDCPGAPSGSNTALDPPDFPPEEPFPNDETTLSTTWNTEAPVTFAPIASLAPNKPSNEQSDSPGAGEEEEDEFELLVSHDGENAQVVDTAELRGLPDDHFARPFVLRLKRQRQHQKDTTSTHRLIFPQQQPYLPLGGGSGRFKYVQNLHRGNSTLILTPVRNSRRRRGPGGRPNGGGHRPKGPQPSQSSATSSANANGGKPSTGAGRTSTTEAPPPPPPLVYINRDVPHINVNSKRRG